MGGGFESFPFVIDLFDTTRGVRALCAPPLLLMCFGRFRSGEHEDGGNARQGGHGEQISGAKGVP